MKSVLVAVSLLFAVPAFAGVEGIYYSPAESAADGDAPEQLVTISNGKIVVVEVYNGATAVDEVPYSVAGNEITVSYDADSVTLECNGSTVMFETEASVDKALFENRGQDLVFKYEGEELVLKTATAEQIARINALPKCTVVK